MPYTYICPKCKTSEMMHRTSRKRLLDYVLSLLNLVPYRCDGCYTRAYHKRRRAGGGFLVSAPSRRS